MASILDKAGTNVGNAYKLISASPLDVRFVVADIAERDSIVTANGCYAGLEVWVESEQKKYIAVPSGTTFNWEEIATTADLPTIPSIDITDTGTKPIVGDITADGHTITVSRVGLDDLGLASAYKYKGSVAAYANLPSTNNTEGDVWNVQTDGMNYAWTGSAWDALGGTVDLSNYVTLDGAQTISGNKTFTGNVVTSNNKFEIKANSNTDDSWIKLTNKSDAGYYAFGIRRPYASYGLQLKIHGTDGTDTYHKIWHAGNDGTGSGLDADLLDGKHASEFQLAGNYLTSESDTLQTVTNRGNSTTNVIKIQNGAASGAFVLGADVNATTLTVNQRKLGRMGVPSYDSTTKTVAGISFDSQPTVNYADFGGHPNNRASIAPDVIRFTVANTHDNKVDGDRTLALQISKQNSLTDMAGGGTSVAAAKFFIPVQTTSGIVNTGTVTSTEGFIHSGIAEANRSNYLLVANGGYKAINDFALATDVPDVSDFVTKSTNQTITGIKTFSHSTFGAIVLKRNGSTNASSIIFQNNNGTLGSIGMTAEVNSGLKRWSADTTSSYTIWDSGNDGSGSGLDADLLDGKHASEFSNYNEGVFYVEGTSETAGTWLGSNSRITEYYDGLIILYKINKAGASTTTLNINNLGAKTVYRYGSNKVTTHFPVNSIIVLSYMADLNSGCWMVLSSYDSTNVDQLRPTYARFYTADALYDYKICGVDKDGRLRPLTITEGTGTSKTVNTAAIRPNEFYYYSTTTNVTAGSIVAANYLYNVYSHTTFHYTFNSTGTTYREIYLKGTLNSTTGLFTLDTTSATSWYTLVPYNTTVTLSDCFVNGSYYILLGRTYSTNNYFTLFPNHPLYKFDGTNLKEIISEAVNADTLDGKHASEFQPAGSYLTDESDTLQTVTNRGTTTTKAIEVAGLKSTGNVSIYVASGATPYLLFQRGTDTDSYNDWGMFGSGGSLYFKNRGSGGTWGSRVTFLQDGGITLDAGNLNVASGSATANSFIKRNSSDDYVLLGGGGTKAISDITGTTYDADRGISLVNGKFGHSNTVITAQSTKGLYKISYDAYGHITGTESFTLPTKNSWNYDDTYVKYSAAQSLTAAQKTQARNNIGAGTSNFSGSYNDLTDKPTFLTSESDTLQTVTDRGATTTKAIEVAGLTSTGNMILHNPDGGDSPKLVFQRGDEKGTVTDWNMYVQSGALKINAVPTSNSTAERNIAEFAYSGGMTIYSPVDSSGEIASMTVKTSNGGQLIIGKESANSGTMLRFDQTAGTTRLRFRSSSTAGAMVWEQPEKAARLYFDFGNAAGNGTNRVNMPNPEGGGTLALTSQLKNGTVTSVGMTVPTGLSVSPATITSSGTFAITYTSGYAIPTTAKQANWDTAYGWGDHSQAGYSKFSGSYNDLTNKPTIGNGTLTLQRGNATVATFTANQTTDTTLVLDNIDDYYWANVHISTTSSKTTEPTFGNVTIAEKVTMEYDSSYKALKFVFA